jgi:hypothetical protein
MKRKIAALMLLTGSFLTALGGSCIPNIGGTAFQDLFNF